MLQYFIGGVYISGGVVYSPDLRTLTCISTGGPATYVTWTRDSVTLTEGTETVLDDPVTATYAHTLKISTAGKYTCVVTISHPMTLQPSFCEVSIHNVFTLLLFKQYWLK